MPGIMDKIAGLFGGKTAKPGAAPTAKSAAKSSLTANAAPPSGGKKGFDINLYIKAVNIFFNDFFKKKLPYFFKNMGPVLKGAPSWFKKLPSDEKAAYGALVLGHVCLLLGIIFFIL